MKRSTTPLVFAVLACSLAVAQDRADQSSVDRLMKRFDKDGNGKVEQSEVEGQLKRRFARFDTNSDGVIDRDELVAVGKAMRANQHRQNRGQRSAKVPDNVELRENVAYREGHARWKVDVMLPKAETDKPRPGIVFVHGGGWRSGDKGGGLWRSLPLTYASKGYVCISVNYRLTGDAPFPACIEDCKCAVRWFRANAKKFNLDPKRIGAYGNSAGAHLVSMLGLAGPDAKLEGDGPFQDQSSMVQAVCCSAPPTDLQNWRSPGQGLDRLFETIPQDNRAALMKKCSPVAHANEGAPPFLIVHGTGDKTVPFNQGTKLQEALKTAGARDVRLMKFEDAGHGVFGQNAGKTFPAMEAFFKRALRGAIQQEQPPGREQR